MRVLCLTCRGHCCDHPTWGWAGDHARTEDVQHACPDCADGYREVPVPTWVPVTERLPDHARDVVVTTARRKLRVASCDGEHWTDSIMVFRRDDVTHWLDGLGLPEAK